MIIGRNYTVGSDGIPSQRVCFPVIISDHSFTTSYDSNGSPYEITRRGLLDDGSYGVIDSLRFCLDGNQLISITEQVTGPNHTGAFHFVGNSQAGRQYAYDKNGNMTKDLNRKVSSIQYNLLNLPTKMYIDDHIIYHNYDLSGRKLQAVYLSKMPDIGVDIDIDWSDTIDYDRPIIIDTLPHIRPTSLMSSSLMSSVTLPDYYLELRTYRFRDTLSYCGPFIYRKDKLVQALYDGGCVTMTDNTPQFRFYQCDHLGSVRAVVKTNGEVLQRNAYYPFGGLYQADASDDTYRYKYNGKELDRTFGHNMYDYGARWQDPYLGLFTTIDPLAEKYYHISPYVYCENNPVLFKDNEGKEKLHYLNKDELLLSDYSLYEGNTPGIINIWMHGVYRSNDSESADIMVTEKKGGQSSGQFIKDAEDFLKLLARDSHEWKKNDGKDLTIVLHSCGTNKLAKKFSESPVFSGKNIKFIAPNNRIRISNYSDGSKKSRVKDKVIHKKGNKKAIIRKEIGRWDVFKDGELIKTYDKNAAPGSIDFKY